MRARGLSMTTPSEFASKVIEERLRLALDDREGELSAVHPLRPEEAALRLAGICRIRTLADIPDDPPEPLLFGMLEPAGPTLLYAAPGTGKGMTGAILVVEAQKAGMRPLIFDAERRPREWSRRVGGLGGDRSKVTYVEPGDLGSALAGEPFWKAAEAVAQLRRISGCDLVIVDSVVPATGVAEERLRSDAQVPFQFVGGLDCLGVPSVTFGHPPKGQPEGDPFGSMAWVAAFRLTWIGTRAEGDGHRIRWRPRKRNERGQIAGILLTIEYGNDGRPCRYQVHDDEQTTRDWLLATLVNGPRSVTELLDERLEAEDEVTEDRLKATRNRFRGALLRMKRDGLVEPIGKGPSTRWRLRSTHRALSQV